MVTSEERGGVTRKEGGLGDKAAMDKSAVGICNCSMEDIANVL